MRRRLVGRGSELPVGAEPQEPEAGPDILDYKEARRSHLEAFEDRFLRTVMARAAGNVQRAAQLSGLNRVNLHRMLVRRGVDPKDFKP